MKDNTGKAQQSPPEQETATVYEQQERFERTIRCTLDLMVGDTHISEQTVIRNDTFAELDDAWFVLVMQVAFHEAFADFDDLTKSEVLAGDSIKTTCCLDYLSLALAHSITG